MSGITIAGAVVVVTGASSGIGRATALGLADRGANVVLAARSSPDLDEVVRACEERGATALAVPTDVSRHEDVEELGRRTIERFGRFDGWVSAAAVMAYGRFWEIPTETFRQVVETNLFGTVHGARVALEHFRAQGHGVLVNISSLYARVTTGFVIPYVVSKFAIRGFTLALRQETGELEGIDVCAVNPQTVDTPIFRHAANYTGSQLTALPLTVDPERVVRAIVSCLERPRPEVMVGVAGRFVALGRAVLPRVYAGITPPVMRRLAFRPGSAPPSHGNVYEPEQELNAVGGGWRAERRTLRRVTALGLTALVAAPVAAWVSRHRSC